MQFTELKVKPCKKISRIALLEHLTNYFFQLNNQIHLIDRHILARQTLGEEDNLINHYGGNRIGA